jgi:hypothetical protein
LCGPCNDVLAVARDRAEYFLGAISYLANPPARKVLHAVSGVRKDTEDHDGRALVSPQRPEDETALRRKRNHGSETALPGVDDYVADFIGAYTNHGIIGNDP